jgi:hypothetical protein
LGLAEIGVEVVGIEDHECGFRVCLSARLAKCEAVNLGNKFSVGRPHLDFLFVQKDVVAAESVFVDAVADFAREAK